MKSIIVNCFLFFISVINSQQTPLGLSYQYLLSSSQITNPEAARYAQTIYEENRKLVQEHNSDPNRTYNLTLNQFAIYSPEQAKQKVLTLIPSVTPAVLFAKSLIDDNNNAQKKHLLSVPRNSPILANSFSNSQTQPQSLNLQNLVLESLRSHLAERNKTEEQINAQIQNRKYSEDGEEIPIVITDGAVNATQRRLQQINEDFQVDWTCVSGQIRFQGACGSCYAMAAADSLSAIMSIYHYEFFVPLSIQELMDCPRNSMTLGCDGGFIEGALAYMNNPGITSQFTYPYSKLSFENSKNGPCKSFQQTQPRYKINSFIALQKGDCLELKNSLKNHPIAVGLSAKRLLLYKDGVFNGCRATDSQDHAVLLIGYNKKKGWRIKNSWGSLWGEKGYAWISEGENGNSCRICNMAFYPIPEKGYRNHSRSLAIKRCQNIL